MPFQIKKISVYTLCAVSISVGIIIGRFMATYPDNSPVSSQYTKLSEGKNSVKNERSQNLGLADLENKKLEDTTKAPVRGISAVATNLATRRANLWMESEGPLDELQLLELGVDKEQISEILATRAQLVGLAANDLVFRQGLQKERFKYLDMIKQATSPEEYETFLEYEKTKPARKEFEAMFEKGLDVAARLNDSDRATLENWMVDLDLLTKQGAEGPLDPLPNPLVGKERVLQGIEEEYNDLNSNLPLLLTRLQEGGFSTDVVDDVEAHYHSELGKLQKTYAILEAPEEKISPAEAIARLRQKVEESTERQDRIERISNRVRGQFDSILEKSGEF